MILRALFSIPLFPLGKPMGRGVFVNRRNPRSRWISPNDVSLNIGDWFHAFANRTPRGAFVRRDEENSYRGATYMTAPPSEERGRPSNNPFG